jgi:hypothetical protein
MAKQIDAQKILDEIIVNGEKLEALAKRESELWELLNDSERDEVRRRLAEARS